jgi:hypothetical protein
MEMLKSKNPVEVKVALQLVNCMLLGILSHEEKSDEVYTLLRYNGLLRILPETLRPENISVCSDQLYDFQDLIKASIHKAWNSPSDIGEKMFRSEVFTDLTRRLASYVGTIGEQDTDINWENAGVLKGEDPVDLFTKTSGWCGVLALYDFLLYDNTSLRKQYVQHVAFVSPEYRFPIMQGSIAVYVLMLF